MATPIIMPRQGQSVESCIISKWVKKKGDQVNVGDILFSYETDKAAFDEEAKTSGTLLDIFAQEGDDVPVLTSVGVIGSVGENIEEFSKLREGTLSSESPLKADSQFAEEKIVLTSAQLVEVPADSEGNIKVSPRAKNLAVKSGVDYRFTQGSGPYGRIIEKDIIELKQKGATATLAAMELLKEKISSGISGTGIGGRITTRDIEASSQIPGFVEPKVLLPALEQPPQPPQPLYDEVKISNIRKVIAKAMHHSLSSTAQLTMNASFDATDVIEFRKKLKLAKDRFGLENITLNDIIVYAVSRTLTNYKDLNAHFMDDRMLYFRNVNMGIAVDTERGLMVPTIFNANLKSLNQISAETKMLIEQCQKGTINPDILKGGSFTITNLGTLDIESFTPIINPPQTGILGVNTIMQRVREVNGDYEYYPAMGLSLTFDHRAIDGAPAARFLKELKTNLENFSVLLVK